MNAFRKIRLAVLLVSLSVLALAAAAPAKAGNHCGPHGCYPTSYCSTYSCYPGFYGSYCRTVPYCPTYNYCPTYSYCLKPICSPVTVYDCYGLPHVVYQTSYSTLLR
jgi:hypothetical protein